jgi:hypothetical protein
MPMLRIQSYRGLIAAALLLATAAGAAAQEFRATVRGLVVDTSQAALPGATVNVQNMETNEIATATTNEEGTYTIPFLRPGLYTMTVEMPGFQKYSRTDMRLNVNQTATINVTLALAGVAEEVTVVSEAPVLETGNANRGDVIDQKRIAELPLQSRSPMALATLVAGVNYNAQAIYLRPFDNGALADWSMNGGANRNNEFLLDGAPNNANQGGNNIAYVPPAEAVQEFKIATNTYDAQYGRTAGGVVNMSLKSGTNSFHGVGYEFYRRKWLDANSFLLNSRQSEKTDHYLDQYGFGLDGPVRIPGLYNGTNKTFFAFYGERYREGTPAPLFATTPTPEMRNGDFSNYRDRNGNLIVIYDPATGREVNGQWVRDPFPGNRIPANRIHSVAQQLLQYYPLPNNVDPAVASWERNLAFPEHFNKDVFWNWSTKVDHNFGVNDRMFVRWAENERNELRNTSPIRSGPAQDGQLPLIRANRAIVGDWVHIFGGNTVLNMRGSYTYYLELSRSDEAFGFDATQIGFPSALVSQLPQRMFPRVNIDDYVQLSRGASENKNYIYTFQPNLSMTRGRHNIRTGLDFRSTHVAGRSLGEAGMRFNFTRGFTSREFNRTDALSGSAFASFLLGAPNDGAIDNNLLPDFYWMYAAPWVQDDWRVTDKLTVNLGFRWDFNSPVKEDQLRQQYMFDPSLSNPVASRINQGALLPGSQVRGGLTFVGVDGNPERPWDWDYNNIQLRAGTAYQLNDRTVLRAGYGRYFLNPTGQGHTAAFSLQTRLIPSIDGNRNPLYNFGDPFPQGVLPAPGSSLGAATLLGRGIAYSNPDFEVPYADHFSAGIQRELPWGVTAEISYAGSRSRRQQSEFRGVNEPSLDFVTQCDVTRGGNRNVCDQLLPNPFFNVPGFEGTARFTNPTIRRFDLMRPFPHFDRIDETERNDGKIDYDSLQFVVNKRWTRGVVANLNYTWVPRYELTGASAGFTQGSREQGDFNAFIDDLTRELYVGPYFTHRDHRLAMSGVYELPLGQGSGGLVGRLLQGWSIAPMFIYQSGQPWRLPTNLEFVGDPSRAALDVKKQGQFIYGVAPCVAQRNAAGQYALLPVAVAYGCTEAFFHVREPFQRREMPFMHDAFRRPSFWQLDMNISKATQITDRVRFQLRLEIFNVFNSPMYDERDYERNVNNTDFGRINRNTVLQSNFQRFVQLGFRLVF